MDPPRALGLCLLTRSRAARHQWSAEPEDQWNTVRDPFSSWVRPQTYELRLIFYWLAQRTWNLQKEFSMGHYAIPTCPPLINMALLSIILTAAYVKIVPVGMPRFPLPQTLSWLFLEAQQKQVISVILCKRSEQKLKIMFKNGPVITYNTNVVSSSCLKCSDIIF